MAAVKDLAEFLRNEGVSDNYIEKIIEDKIDCKALLMIDNETLKNYIPAYGDQLKAIAFCKLKTDSTLGDTADGAGYEKVLDRLKSKVKENRRDPKKLQGNRNALKSKRRVELGWMDFNMSSQTFKQVRTNKGGGTRHLLVDKQDTIEEILSVGKNMFFPNGYSNVGDVNEFHTEMKDFQGRHMSSSLTVEEAYDISKLRILRLYLYTTNKKAKNIEDKNKEDMCESIASPVAVSSKEDSCQSTCSIDQSIATMDDDQSVNDSEMEIQDSGTPTVIFNRRLRFTRSIPGPVDSRSQEGQYHFSSDLEAPTNIKETDNSTGDPVECSSSGCQENSVSEAVDVTSSTLTIRRRNLSLTHRREVAMANQQREASSQLTGSQNLYGSDVIIENDCQYFNDESDAELQAVIRKSLESTVPDQTLQGVLQWWIGKTLVKDDEIIEILVQRERVLSSTLRVMARPSFKLTSPMKCVFSGESGDDLGGPRREYFRELMKEIEGDILQGSESGSKFFQHDIKKIEEKRYETAGKLVSYSILHGGPSLQVFNHYLCHLMFDQDDINLCDFPLNELDIDLKERLLEIRNASTQEELDSFCVNNADWIIDQGLTSVNLKMKDKEKIVSMLIKNEIFYRVHRELTQFIAGLNVNGLCDAFALSSIPREILQLFIPNQKKLTFMSIRELYCIQFSENGSNDRKRENDVIYCFETFLSDCEAGLTDVSLEDMLVFWTGAEKPPPLGFDQKLQVTFVSNEELLLPVAHTCGMHLELWRGFSDPDDFRGKMVQAITLGGGFHLA